MDLFILDTDILTLFQLGHATVVARVAEHSTDRITVSVVTVEEQLSGWYAQLRKAKDSEKMAWAYRRLAANVRFIAQIPILDFEQPVIERSALAACGFAGSSEGDGCSPTRRKRKTIAQLKLK